MKSLTRRSFRHAVLDSAIWYCYLLVMFSASLLNQPFMSEAWLMATLAIYFLLGLAALSASMGGRCNWSAIYAARIPIALFSLSIGYIYLQHLLPFQTKAHHLLLSVVDAPDWFNPHFVWSVAPSKTKILALSEIMMLGIFLLSLALISSRKRLIQFLFLMTLICLFHAAIGIFAKLSSISLVDLKLVDGHYRAARGWFVNRNHFAAFISLALVGALSLQFKELIGINGYANKFKFLEQVVSYRVLYLLSILIAILALVLSESRSGFLSILISLVCVVWMIGGRQKQVFSRRILIIPVSFIAVATLLYFGADLVQRFGLGNDFLGERSEQWSITLEAIRGEWLFGYGGNTYAEVFQMNRGYSDLRDVIYDQSHNDYLHIWLEQGLVGLCLWCAFLAISIRSAVLGLAKTSSTLVNAVVISGVVVIIAALIQSVVGFNLHIINIRFYFFAIMALIIASPTISQRKSRGGPTLLV